MTIKNGDMSAMPTSPNAHDPERAAAVTGGLTKREQFAMAAMQGVLAYSTRYKPHDVASSNWHEAISEEAVQIADALLAELAKADGGE